MGIFGNFFKKTSKEKSFEAKEKCDFCDEQFCGSPIKIMAFTFMGEVQYQCCQSCFDKAYKNDMRITSLQMIKDYIAKENIEYANDQRLKNFFGAQVYQHGLWITINNYEFFTNPNIGLSLNSEAKNFISSSDNVTHTGDTSCFWTSYIVAELTHSPIAGYLVGGSFVGALLGSSSSSSSNSFNSSEVSSGSSSSNSDCNSNVTHSSSSSNSIWDDSGNSSCSSWGGGDSSSGSSWGDSGGSCGCGD